MTYRSLHTIFEPSGQPIPSEEEVLFEAREIVSRSGWGLPLIEALRKVHDPYWREAVARCLMEYWQDLVRDKDEQTYYYDMDGDIRYCWTDAEYDFGRIIRTSTHEQVDIEQAVPTPQPQPVKTSVVKARAPKQKVKIYFETSIDTMENEIKHIGYNVEQMTINMNGGTLVQHADLVQASGEVVIDRHSTVSSQPSEAQAEEAKETKQHFPLLTAQCIQEGKAEAVEAELRSAAKGSAQKLMQCIRTNEALGYLDTKNLSSQALYDALNAYFGLRYGVRNFTKYRE